MAGGRPTKYEGEKTVRQAYSIVSKLGATGPELAQALDVSIDTISEWQNKYPQFSAAIKDGRDYFDTIQIENALAARARGMRKKTITTDEDGNVVIKEEELPPDPTSMIFWLKNRNKDRWRDKTDVEHSGNVEVISNVFEKK